MVHVLIGALFVAALWAIVGAARNKGRKVSWGGWLLTVLGLVYAAFVAEVIASLVIEDSGQAALVIGGAMALIAVIWGVLMGRLVFAKAARAGL
jgi:hypothetical protein